MPIICKSVDFKVYKWFSATNYNFDSYYRDILHDVDLQSVTDNHTFLRNRIIKHIYISTVEHPQHKLVLNLDIRYKNGTNPVGLMWIIYE